MTAGRSVSSTPAEDHPDRLRRSCQQVLAAWRAPSPEQDRLRADYLDHLRAHADGWSRSCPKAHLTASSLICAVERRCVLLTLHARIGRWLQTGGHIEPADVSLQHAVLREAMEESGLAELEIGTAPVLLSRHEVPCGPVRPTYHLDVQYLLLATDVIPPRSGAESLDVRWFDVDHLPDVDRSVLDLVAAAHGHLRW